MRGIERRRGDQRQRTAALGVGAHRHQHAAHVGVVDDRRAAGHRAVDRARLHPLLGERRGLLVGALGDGDSLHADRVARRVHHDEHVLEAAVLLADERADRARPVEPRAALVAELEHRRRARLDAELVLDADAPGVVPGAGRAVGVDQEFRHDEETDSLDALGRAGDAREHQMDDVLGHVVLAVGDEDLGAEDLVAAVAERLGAGANQREIRAGLRLGQVHRPGPLARDHLRDEAVLLLARAGGEQRLDRAVGEQRAEREAEVGAVDHLDARRADRLRQALAAEVARVLQALPAARAELAKRVLEAGGRRHDAVLERRWVDVALAVERREHLLAEARALLEHRLGGVEAGLLEARQARHGLEIGELLHAEQHVLHGRGVAHDFLSSETVRRRGCWRREKARRPISR